MNLTTPGSTNDTTLSTVLTVVRYIVVTGGGWLVGKGYVTGDQLAQFGGIAVAVVTLGFGVYSTLRSKSQLKQAIAAPVGQATP